jgi:hypothetical protein
VIKANGSQSYCKNIDQICQYVKNQLDKIRAMELHHYKQRMRLLCYDYTSSWIKQSLDRIAEEIIHACP